MTAAVRREVEELHAVVRRAQAAASGTGLYAPRSSAGRQYATALHKAVRHELETLAGIVERLDKATAPKPVPHLRVPGKGTVARVVLEVLHVDALVHDYDKPARALTGLTDAELAVRVEGAGINSVRPRRVELVRAGWVEVAGQTGDATRWTLTAEGRAKLEEVVAGG